VFVDSVRNLLALEGVSFLLNLLSSFFLTLAQDEVDDDGYMYWFPGAVLGSGAEANEGPILEGLGGICYFLLVCVASFPVFLSCFLLSVSLFRSPCFSFVTVSFAFEVSQHFLVFLCFILLQLE